MLEPIKQKFKVELDGNWVLKHRDDDVLPIDAIKAELEKAKTFTITEVSLTSLTVIYSQNDADFTGLKAYIVRFFRSRYPEDRPKDVLSFVSGVVEDKEEKADSRPRDAKDEEPKTDEGKDDSAKNAYRELVKMLRGDSDEDDRSDSDKEKSVGAIEKINSVVGAMEFKSLAKEIAGIAEEIKRTNTHEVFTHQCYLFSIGDGCGLTTYLELFAGLIEECDLCRMATSAVSEVRLGAYREGLEPFEEAIHTIENGNAKKVRVVCVDISEWMDRTDNRYFKQFLRLVEKHADEHIVVFRVPFVDKDILSRIGYSLSDLLSIKSVSFPPLNQEEMKRCAEEELKRFDFTVTKSAWPYFFDRISEEKSDGKFYGVSTIKKVVRELVYQKHVVNVQKTAKSNQITANDAKAICENATVNKLSGAEQLDRLVGVEGIKKQINEIIAQIELAVKDGSGERPCIHMRFVGNPGTGKTTVARIIGKILKEKGILRVGGFFEYAGRDFCGRYIGETAPKTASICRDAYGSVLFIDEAYSLYRGDDDTRDYGREAIDTLIAEMENHRNDFVVIMAGYTGDMDKLMGGNLGLASRMPYTLEFPNFTGEQLYAIFVSMAKEKFKCEQGLFDAAHTFFTELPDDLLSSKEFSNARYVRNLFERTWAKAAMRCQLSGKTNVVLTRDDFEHASADKDFATHIPKKARLGFYN